MQALTKTYKPACLQSTTTSDVDGGVPSTPKAARLSSRDKPKCASSATSHQCAPSPVPGSSCCRPDGPRLRPGFGPREICDEEASFIRPASTHFTRPKRQGALCHARLSVLGRSALCVVEPASKWLHQQRRWRRGLPSARSADTMVVSTASCAPWNSGNPSAMISIRRLSGLPKGSKSRS